MTYDGYERLSLSHTVLSSYVALEFLDTTYFLTYRESERLIFQFSLSVDWNRLASLEEEAV